MQRYHLAKSEESTLALAAPEGATAAKRRQISYFIVYSWSPERVIGGGSQKRWID